MEIGFDLRVACVMGPTSGSSVPEQVLYVETCAAFDEEMHDLFMAPRRSLVERGGVRLAANRVVTVGVFTGVEKESDDLEMTEIRCRSEGEVAFVVGG